MVLRLQGLPSTLLFLADMVLVEARTNWSDKLQFLRCSKISLASVKVLVVFDFSSKDQFIGMTSKYRWWQLRRFGGVCNHPILIVAIGFLYIIQQLRPETLIDAL